ncbi:MAG: two-component system, OmpR family, response regulator [Thermoanaerobaculia bacterium]|nr:two-component system, OmpR family, response regulator [Thermoanaerobaculia bacterium]
MKSAIPMSRGRVLIVDDHPEILEGMKMLLEMEGMDVTTHDSVITLPLILRKADPEVILLDLSLPALSGESFFALGRERLLRHTNAFVILFSGRPLAELAANAEQFGADGVLPKSEDAMQAVARVKTWIEQHRALRRAQRMEMIDVTTGSASASSH